MDNLRDGLQRAEQLTRQGELGDAVWEYLEVLEVDPDNATARKQVGKVATAVRQFDQTAPGRRWQKKLQRQTAFRRWLANWNSDGERRLGRQHLLVRSSWSRNGDWLFPRAMGDDPAAPPPAVAAPAEPSSPAETSSTAVRGRIVADSFAILC